MDENFVALVTIAREETRQSSSPDRLGSYPPLAFKSMVIVIRHLARATGPSAEGRPRLTFTGSRGASSYDSTTTDYNFKVLIFTSISAQEE